MLNDNCFLLFLIFYFMVNNPIIHWISMIIVEVVYKEVAIKNKYEVLNFMVLVDCVII
jgi:hypothetical protein